MLERIAYSLGSRSEEPNITLAAELCEKNDAEGVASIAAGLKDKNPNIASDCIKVLYETGRRNPGLIAPYVQVFLSLLKSKNNRMVWGAMAALSFAAELKPHEIYRDIDTVLKAYENGSVITVDYSISVFAALCKADESYSRRLFHVILKHLAECRPKEIPQHAERALPCVTQANREAFISVLNKRKDLLSEPQRKRVERVIKTVS